MNTPKEPSTIPAIELTVALCELEQLRRQHAEAMAEIAALRAELARFYAAENKHSAIDAGFDE